jgi:uncharacterized membrane protein
MSLVKNLGSTFIYLGIYVLGFIVLAIFILIKRFSKKFEKVENWISSQLMWNSTLRFVL